ncbi:MAG: cellulase family glycosylhydrolase [Oscillospiraceae bacterium]|nr:cellulase family glycosylhydrolase [Oscillospiraceae bacterium]
MRKFISLLTAAVMSLTLMLTGVNVSAENAAVSFRSKTITVTPGRSITLTPKVTGAKADELTWSSSDPCVTVADGKIIGVSQGKAVVTAQIRNTAASATVNIRVGKRISEIVVKDTNVTLRPGQIYEAKPGIKPADAAYKGVSYSVSDKSVISISKDGKVGALKAGTATLTIKAADGSGCKAVITFSVSDTAAPAKTEETAEEKPAEEPKAEEKAEEQPAQVSAKALPNFDTTLSALDLTAQMTVGWNLGNSLDATGSANLMTETSWGNPKTTQKMILDIKAAGFNTVRIPVSWSKHVDANGVIDVKWLDRVQEVVNYAYHNQMFVILDTHHDEELFPIMKMTTDEAAYENSFKVMKNIWKQISERFLGYGHRLIFETLNEPRTKGSAKEWQGGTTEERRVVAELNQALVDTIRSTGGNNAYRFIMCPAHNATSDTNVLRNFTFPDDPRVIISVHAYNPWSFAGDGNGPSTFTDSDRNSLLGMFTALDDIFIKNGRAVIIGEMGATNKDNPEDRNAWADFFIRNAKEHHIPCVIWDNNCANTGAENFGLYDRTKEEFYFPEYIDVITEAGKNA